MVSVDEMGKSSARMCQQGKAWLKLLDPGMAFPLCGEITKVTGSRHTSISGSEFGEGQEGQVSSPKLHLNQK